MAKKGPMKSYASVDDYIAEQTAEAQSMLSEIRALIHEVAPEVLELPDTKAPSFTLVPEHKPRLQLMMSAMAKFIGFYPFPETLAVFADRLSGYKLGKGSVQFPLGEPLPTELIREMIAHRRDSIVGNI